MDKHNNQDNIPENIQSVGHDENKDNHAKKILFKEKIARRNKKRKKRRVITLTLSAIVIVLALVLYILFLAPYKCLGTQAIVIPPKSSLPQIADILKEKNVISNKYALMARAFTSGKYKKLNHGSFTFKEGMSYEEIINLMYEKSAKKETVSVTIPEGYSVEMIVKKFTDSGFGTPEEFELALNAEYDFEFLKHIKVSTDCKYKLQGLLFPSTYEFYKDATAKDIIKRMLSEFEKEYKKTGYSYDDISTIITKASMIEREAKLDSERATIAGVIENRLAIDMKLDIDATVTYAKSNGMYDITITKSDYDSVESAYNTYKNKGLPAGPICNPGFKSIEAAINPEKHDFLYYCTTPAGDGSHYFTKTYEEHLNYIKQKNQTQ